LSHIYISLMFCHYIFCIYSYRLWNIFTLLLNVTLSHIHISLMFCHYISCIYSYTLRNIFTLLLNLILSHIHNIELYIKQWLDSRQILYYKTYVDNILIIYDQNKTNEQDILNHANNIDKHLQFKLSTEKNNIINYLDLSVYRISRKIELGIYWKPVSTDTTIQFSSNHPYEHKLAALNYYTNRLLTLHTTKEWNNRGGKPY
jgi:hypothetical protein